MSELARHGGETSDNAAEPGHSSIEERAPEPLAPDRPSTTADAVDRPVDIRARMAADDTFARLDYIRREQPTPENDDSAAPDPRQPAEESDRVEQPGDAQPAAPAEDTPASGRSLDLQARMAEDDTFARLDQIRPSAQIADKQTTMSGTTEGKDGPADGAREVSGAPTADQQGSESQNGRDVLALPQPTDPSGQRARAEPSDLEANEVGSGDDRSGLQREVDFQDRKQPDQPSNTDASEIASSNDSTDETVDEGSSNRRDEAENLEPSPDEPLAVTAQDSSTSNDPPSSSTNGDGTGLADGAADTRDEQQEEQEGDLASESQIAEADVSRDDRPAEPEQSDKAVVDETEVLQDLGDGSPESPNADQPAAYSLDVEIEDGLTAREVVTRFDPERANLEPMSVDEAVRYVAANKDSRPWLAPAVDCDPAVQRVYASLDAGLGHAHHRHDGMGEEDLYRRRAAYLEDPAQLNPTDRNRSQDAFKAGIHRCGSEATRIQDPVAFATAISAGISHPEIRAVLDAEYTGPVAFVRIPIVDLLGVDGHASCTGHRLTGGSQDSYAHRDSWAKARRNPEIGVNLFVEPRTEAIDSFEGGTMVFGFVKSAAGGDLKYELATMFPTPREPDDDYY